MVINRIIIIRGVTNVEEEAEEDIEEVMAIASIEAVDMEREMADKDLLEITLQKAL